jgi:AcrR family transcriptional regulator
MLRKNGDMDTEATDSVGLSRAGRPAMPRDQILVAALELVDAHGADEFSLRLLAKQLRSSTATLYRHFASKEAILAAVGEVVLGEVQGILSDRSGGDDWPADLVAAAEAVYRTFEQHPNVVSVVSEGVALGPHALALREHVLAGLLEAGFPPLVASQAFTSVMRYTIGFCAQLGGLDVSVGESGRDLHAFFTGLDRAQYPAIAASAPHLPVALHDEFRFGLVCLVEGLALLQRP